MNMKYLATHKNAEKYNNLIFRVPTNRNCQDFLLRSRKVKKIVN